MPEGKKQESNEVSRIDLGMCEAGTPADCTSGLHGVVGEGKSQLLFQHGLTSETATRSLLWMNLAKASADAEADLVWTVDSVQQRLVDLIEIASMI